MARDRKIPIFRYPWSFVNNLERLFLKCEIILFSSIYRFGCTGLQSLTYRIVHDDTYGGAEPLMQGGVDLAVGGFVFRNLAVNDFVHCAAPCSRCIVISSQFRRYSSDYGMKYRLFCVQLHWHVSQTVH